jgi:hypothetical protein
MLGGDLGQNTEVAVLTQRNSSGKDPYSFQQACRLDSGDTAGPVLEMGQRATRMACA